MRPCNKGEVELVKGKIRDEMRRQDQLFTDKEGKGSYTELFNKRIVDYCKMHYKTAKTTKTELRTDTVCMREIPFFVDTVRDFRDRRYDYKRAVKRELGNLKEVSKTGNQAEIERT